MQIALRARKSVLIITTVLLAPRAQAMTINVPNDFGTIQAALNAAGPGDIVEVCAQAQPYFEKVSFPASGSAGGGFITLQACAGQTPILDGTGVAGDNMILIENRSYVKVIGFEIRNNLNVSDGSGVRVLGAGSHIEIRDNEIHEIRGQDAMGITVYGTESTAISDLIIDGNLIYDCDPFRSEALVLNGNVSDFAVTNNIVRDVNNIGIDFIGGETDIQPNSNLVARDGVCRGNLVIRANEQGGGFAGGIYVDGGRDIVIENNVVTESDLGIEIGAENAGSITSGIIVRDNVVYENDKTGIVFGGFSAGVGRTKNCHFLNNTLYRNDTQREGFGELWIQYAEDNVVRNNIFYGIGQNPLTYSENGNLNNDLDYNLWFSADGSSAEFIWRNSSHVGFAAFQGASGEDVNGIFVDPSWVNPGAADFHLTQTSPAIGAGDPAFVPAPGEVDLDGDPRLNGTRVEIGADEVSLCGDGMTDPGEECDDMNLVDGDGCDSNCTFTACGNGIVTSGETCDDGNTAAGDCCSATCQFETAGSSCDDGELCTQLDACDGAGSCLGLAQPAALCRAPVASGKAKVLLKDKGNDAGDTLLFRWSKGAATSLGDLGDPTASTDYRLCLYDGSGAPTPLLGATATAGGKWSASSSGYRYKDSDRSPDGVLKAKLKAGDAGQAKVLLKAKGQNLDMPVLGLTAPVTVQLRNANGGCWGATFSTPSSNAAGIFKAKSD